MGTPSRDAVATESQPYVVDEQVGFLMRVAVQRHTAIFSSLIPEGLTPPQFAAMAKLLEVGSCSQNSLGRLIFLDGATIKGVVGRLEKRGYVVTEPDLKDRRRRQVKLTDAGARIARCAVEAGRAITEKTLEPLSPKERRVLCSLLERIA